MINISAVHSGFIDVFQNHVQLFFNFEIHDWVLK